MSEGTAVPAVRRWATTEMQALTGSGEEFEGVRVQYSPIRNLDQAVADGGDIEAVYWDRWRTSIEPRAFKGTAHIKYREEATADLIIVVASRDADSTYENVDQRAAELVGGVVKVFQSGQPTSPGAHLPNISAYVSSIEADPGILQSAGVGVYAVTLRVEVTIQASVEQ